MKKEELETLREILLEIVEAVEDGRIRCDSIKWRINKLLKNYETKQTK